MLVSNLFLHLSNLHNKANRFVRRTNKAFEIESELCVGFNMVQLSTFKALESGESIA